MGASSDIALYVSRLPADPGQWSYEDFVAALREVDNRSTWAKVRIIGLMTRRFGAANPVVLDAARDVGLSAATVANYRAVDEAYPVAEFGQPNCPVGVALAFIALGDKKALVSRAEPWTREEAREYAAQRARAALPPGKRGPGRPRKAAREDPHADLRGKPDRGKAGKPSVSADHTPNGSKTAEDSEPETEENTASTASSPSSPVQGGVKTGTTGTAAAATTSAEPGPEPEPQPDPRQCPGCRNLEAKLEQAHEEIARLKAAHPDVVMAEEIKVVTDQWDALQAQVAQLSEALRAAERGGPGNGSLTTADTADSARSEPGGQPEPIGPCASCGKPGRPYLFDDDETGRFACDPCFRKEAARNPLLSRRAA